MDVDGVNDDLAADEYFVNVRHLKEIERWAVNFLQRAIYHLWPNRADDTDELAMARLELAMAIHRIHNAAFERARREERAA